MKIKLFLSAALFLAATFSSTAQTCNTTLKSKSGKVYSASPGVIQVSNIKGKSVTVKIKKTGGKAETQVNFYINGVMQPKVANFENGSYKNPNWTVRTFPNMQGKSLKVKVVNQSVANTFSYTCRIIGKTSNLMNGASTVTGNLAGNTKKTIYTKSGCTNKTKVTIRRTSGKARATYRVWQKMPNGSWSEMLNQNGTIEKTESIQVINIPTNRALKIEVKNVSVGNFFGYRMTARVG